MQEVNRPSVVIGAINYSVKISGTVMNATDHPAIIAKVSVRVMLATSNSETILDVVRFTPPAAHFSRSDQTHH